MCERVPECERDKERGQNASERRARIPLCTSISISSASAAEEPPNTLPIIFGRYTATRLETGSSVSPRPDADVSSIICIAHSGRRKEKRGGVNLKKKRKYGERCVRGWVGEGCIRRCVREGILLIM